MRKRTRFSRRHSDALRARDFAVILFGLLSSAFFGFLFWKDLNSATTRNDKIVVAHLQSKQRIVQRKFNDRVVWERIPQNSALYDEDTIRTSSGAEAMISLDDDEGTKLEMRGNSMIQITYSEEGGAQIIVSNGSIQVDSPEGSKPVSVKFSDGSVVEVDGGTQVSVSSGDNMKPGIEVIEGNVRVKSGEKMAVLSSGQSASITDKDGSPSISRKALTVISPPKEMTLLLFDGTQSIVDFSWNAFGAEHDVVIQTSPSRDFRTVDYERVVRSGDGRHVSIEVGPGATYWRVFSDDGSGTPDYSAGRIVSERIAPAELFSPTDGCAFPERTQPPRVDFRWQGNRFAAHYRLVISTSPDLSEIVHSSEHNDAFASVSSLGEGTYYWNVEPYYPANGTGFAGASEIRSFRIEKESETRPPELSSPADGAEIAWKESRTVPLIWKSDIKDAEYNVIVARKRNFSDARFAATTKSKRAEFSADEDGTYWWKVVRHSGDPSVSDSKPESEPRSFTIRKFVPEKTKLLSPADGYSFESVSANDFLWKSSAEDIKNGAVMRISDAAGNKSGECGAGKNLPDDFSLAKGSYTWGIFSADGKEITKPRSFSVMGFLSAPAILIPQDGSELVVEKDRAVAIEWKPVKGADSYSVKLSGAGIKREFDIKEDGSGTMRADVTLPEGIFTAEIRANSKSSESAQARRSSFSAVSFSARRPDEISELSPARGEKIGGLAALRKPTAFRWETGRDSSKTFTFTLDRKTNGGDSEKVETIRTSKKSLSLKRMKSGTYEWKVTGKTASGIALESKSSVFTVLPVPDLPTPVAVTPKNGTVFDGAYFRENRRIEFRWKAVSGATSYTFTLRRKSGKSILSRTLSSTRIEISDLSLFDVGSFEYSVTARQVASDGFVERKSKALEAEFTIKFDLPKQVETKTPGKMYGE